MSKKEKKQENTGFAIGKENYRIMIAGVVILVIGMLLMIGGGSDDPNKFSGDELFSFRRITLAPVVILVGFVVVMVAIIRKPKAEDHDAGE
jgi:fumarate reductase subunit D